jgi:hypothetical protein
MTTTANDRTRRSFVMEEAVAILARTPGTLDAMLRGLGDGWIAAHEGESTWSPFDVVGHLIHGERTDWMPPQNSSRTLICPTRGVLVCELTRPKFALVMLVWIPPKTTC